MPALQELSAVDILSRLVAFDTTSRHSNLALIGWVEEDRSTEWWRFVRGLESRSTG